ncbi:hypothetical protein ABQJ54_02760 [Rhodanobacter sp. Si-c]|uniref:Tol-pal system protein YbgF n=1 Tax=Rhodanobacter lycopersici TaxID=3162487 RepID=A0ABV3QA56_9GAMM
MLLAGVLLAAPLSAQAWQQPAANAARVARAVHKNAAAVDQQRAKVQDLQHDVAAQEAGSRAAAQRLEQQDAEIAELQRQLQAAQQAGAGAAPGKGH